MAKQTTTDIVADFAREVGIFAVQAEQAQADKKLARALKALADTIGAEPVILGENIWNPDDLLESVDLLTQRESDNTDASTELVKTAKKVEVFVEAEVLEEDDSDIAIQALALWTTVKPSGRLLMASRGGTSEGRVSSPDFDFPIFATCEICGDTVRTGERSGQTDWNSLRHYAQRHAQNVHAAVKFDNYVTNAWRNAKAAFESGETSVAVDGDDSAPGFVLEAQVA